MRTKDESQHSKEIYKRETFLHIYIWFFDYKVGKLYQNIFLLFFDLFSLFLIAHQLLWVT